MSSTYTPAGEGWIEGPPFPPDVQKGPVETIRRTVSTATGGDREQVWHRRAEIVPLPTRPGYYVTDGTFRGIVVQLLNTPAGQWVDAADRTYLAIGQVQALGRLQPLARVEEILNEVALISISDHDPRPVWEQFREGLDAIAAQYGVHR